jgi:hypothetical protein
MLPRSLAAGPGGWCPGYDEVTYTQLQTSVIKFFEQVGCGPRLPRRGDRRGVWIGGMDDGINYGRSPAYGATPSSPSQPAAAAARSAPDHRCADQL